MCRSVSAPPALLLLACLAASTPTVIAAAPEAPTIQALLAAQDAELTRSVLAWDSEAFDLPDNMMLDPSLRESAAELVREHSGRLKSLLPVWIAEERSLAKDPYLTRDTLFGLLFRRLLNEQALQSVESVGAAHDEAALKAALSPTACTWVYVTPFANRVALMQAAPPEIRPALLAAERELLSHWGTPREGLVPRPGTAELLAAAHAVTRLREGLPVAGVPMTPFFAAQVFAREPRKVPDRWDICARNQWWLQSQLAGGKVTPTKALVIYRYSMLPDVSQLVRSNFKVPPVAKAEGKPTYPRAAAYFNVEGSVRLHVSLDGQGGAWQVEVATRDIRVPGVRDNRPVAFEGLLDDASLDFARRRSYPIGKTGEAEFTLDWRLNQNEENDETK